jgi:REP element-mobilizing transposase RayT
MQLSPSGKIVREEWLKTTQIRQEVKLHEDEFVIMPNHIHGIIWIVETLTGEATLKSIESVAVVGATRRVAPTRQGQRRLEELNYFKKG